MLLGKIIRDKTSKNYVQKAEKIMTRENPEEFLVHINYSH